MPKDEYPGQMAGLSSSSDDFATVTPSNDTDLARLPTMLVVAASGNMVCHNKNGDSVTFTGLTAGQELRSIRPKRILATGTTASIVAIY